MAALRFLPPHDTSRNVTTPPPPYTFLSLQPEKVFFLVVVSQDAAEDSLVLFLSLFLSSFFSFSH